MQNDGFAVGGLGLESPAERESGVQVGHLVRLSGPGGGMEDDVHAGFLSR